MAMTILLSGFHYLALALGLSGIAMRALQFRKLRASPSDPDTLRALFQADNLWGVAAILWLATGLLRAFAGYEKGTDFYLASSMFHLKMGLFALVFLLELWPMVALIRWRLALRKDSSWRPNPGPISSFYRMSQAQLVLVVILPFVAAAMARGVGLR